MNYPANARELALKSYAEQLRREGRLQRARQAQLEARSAPLTRPARRKSKKHPPRTTRKNIAWARAMANAHRFHRRLADFPLSPFAEDWEIDSVKDVHRAVLAVEVGHAKGPKEAAIKACIYDRAKALDCLQVVPPGWKGNWQ